MAPLASFEPEGPECGDFGVSPRLVNAKVQGAIPTKFEGCATVWEVVKRSVSQFPNRDAVGTRALLKREYEKSSDGKKSFEKMTLDTEIKYLTYGQFGERVSKIGSGFAGMGLKKKDRVLIFAETQADWIVTMCACHRQGLCVVTAYATLGEEGVTTSVQQSKAQICVCDAKLWTVVKESQPKCPTLKFVVPILTKADTVTVEEMQKEFGNGVTVKSLDDIAQTTTIDPTPPEPQDMAVLMYTSGTTGKSKGVMISHENITSTVLSASSWLSFVNKEATYLAYLPLAHIMELAVEVTMLGLGARMGYGNAQTLTDTGLKLAKGQLGDAKIVKPTMMVFAPAVLDKIYNAVNDKVNAAGGCKKTMFDKALAAGYSNYDSGGVGCGCCGNLIMKSSVQVLLGGQVRNCLTGSAPLSAEIQKFAQSCFNAPVRQGYGLTETCAASCIAATEDNTLGQVGPPTPGTVIRLRDWPEGGYTNADEKKPEIGTRRGEVLIGGPMVTMGYLEDDENPDPDVKKKNVEDYITIAGERYFCSGDIGQITKNGCLQIVDRKKDLFKGANGEYVSLSKVESFLKLSPYVEMPMVVGKTGAKSVIALICPKKHMIEKLAKEKGATGDFVTLCKNDVIIKEVAATCVKECKAGKLNSFEIPSAIALCATVTGEPAWSPDNEMLTTTLKLKRPIITKAFDAEIEEAYARSA